MKRLKDKMFKLKMKKQRYKKGYADEDLWNLDCWFLTTFREMIKEFRDRTIGAGEHEYEEIEKFPLEWLIPEIERLDDIRYINDGENFDIDSIFDRWYLILSRIVYCLGEVNEDTCSMQNEYEEEFDKNYLDKNCSEEKLKELSAKYFGECTKIEKYREKMKDEAFDLLKKYFGNLWW